MNEISVRELKEKLDSGENLYLLDVREPGEFEICALEGSTLVPLGELMRRSDEIEPPEGALVVTICHHGVRSLQAAGILLHQLGMENEVVSLKGGIDAWSAIIDPSVPRY